MISLGFVNPQALRRYCVEVLINPNLGTRALVVKPNMSLAPQLENFPLRCQKSEQLSDGFLAYPFANHHNSSGIGRRFSRCCVGANKITSDTYGSTQSPRAIVFAHTKTRSLTCSCPTVRRQHLTSRPALDWCNHTSVVGQPSYTTANRE